MTDVDFDSAGHLLATGTKSVLVVGHPEIRKVRFRHMNNETTHLARNMIRALGTALGPNHGAVFVDSCIADLFEVCDLESNIANLWSEKAMGIGCTSG